MPIWLQHVLVLTLAAICLVIAAWQGIQSLRGKSGRIGSCCAKGCGRVQGSDQGGGQSVVFIPSDALRRQRP